MNWRWFRPPLSARWRVGLTFLCALCAGQLAAQVLSARAVGQVPDKTAGATFNVNSTDDAVDSMPGDGVCDAAPPAGQCTVRAAVQEANSLPGADTILIPAGTYTLTLSGAGEDAAATGDLDIASVLNIDGAGVDATVLNGGQLDTVIHVLASAKVQLRALTVRNGNGVGLAGGIRNGGRLTLISTSVTANSATADGNGGGIANGGMLDVQSSRVMANSAGGQGGGIYNTGTLTVISTTVGINTAGSDGGGLANAVGSATVWETTFENNQSAGGGGGIWNDAGLALHNTTVSLNRSDLSGAGLALHAGAGSASLNNVTIANNITKGSGGGLRIDGGAPALQNTLLGGNLDDDHQGTLGTSDCVGIVNSHGHNLIETGAGCSITGDTTGNLVDVAAGIMALSNNGGTMRTHALRPGSAAIEAGSPSQPGSGGQACEATDQRGISRPQVYHCDIGAFELEGDPVTATPTPTGQPTATPTATGTATATSTATATGTMPPSATADNRTTTPPVSTSTATPTGSLEGTPTVRPPSPSPTRSPTTAPSGTRTPSRTAAATRTPTRGTPGPNRRYIYAPIVVKRQVLP